MGIIIWGNRKLFSQNEKAVSIAMAPLLAETNLMGRGAYSMIFRGADTVFKLTADRVAYELAECQLQWQCASLPLVKGLHGEVGATDGGIPLFLMEIEHLEKLAEGTEARRLCLSIGRRVQQNRGHCETATEQLRDAASFLPNGSVREALEHLADFAETRADRALLDMHGSNFMQRPSTGKIVLSDPFLDAEVRRKAQKIYLLARGLPEATGFW
jgi:hypothetical protein